jgi:hypothetical protein
MISHLPLDSLRITSQGSGTIMLPLIVGLKLKL